MSKIDLNDYGVFPVELREVFPGGGFDLKDFLFRMLTDVNLKASINKVKGCFVMDFNISFNAETDCARCLKRIELNIDRNERVYLFDKSLEGNKGNLDLEENELDNYYLEDLILDLDDFVNEQVIISLPAKALCNTACKGLCPFCGTDLNKAECGCIKENIDPRWEALKMK